MTEMLYITSVDISVPNGPGVNELQFVRSASRVIGNKVRFVLPSPANPLPDDFPEEKVDFLPKFQRRAPLSWFCHQIQKTRAIRAATLQHSPNYVVFRSGVMPIAEVLACRLLPPYFLKTAGSGRFEVFDRSLLRRLLKPIHNALFNHLLKHSAGADVVTDIHRRSLEETFPTIANRVEVFDNAVDTDAFYRTEASDLKSKLGLADFRYLIGYVGNLADIRGGTELLRSWQHIEQRDETGLIVVSGDGRGKEELTHLAVELSIADRFLFCGPVPMSDVKEYMSLFDIGVSFRDDDGSSELKVRQYLACGTPVLVSSQVNEFVDNADIGITVPRTDFAGIGNAASDILAQRRCSDQGRIEQYALENLGYDAMIQQRREYWMMCSDKTMAKKAKG